MGRQTAVVAFWHGFSFDYVQNILAVVRSEQFSQLLTVFQTVRQHALICRIRHVTDNKNKLLPLIYNLFTVFQKQRNKQHHHSSFSTPKIVGKL